MATVEQIVKKHGKQREKLLPILQDIVQQERYLTEDSMVSVAQQLGLSSAEVYGVASFYTFLDIKPKGKNIIRLCKNISCDLSGKEKIANALEEKLRIKMGETTADSRFSLLSTNCMGWCHQGPAMLINDEVYTELTPEKAVEVIDKYMSNGN